MKTRRRPKRPDDKRNGDQRNDGQAPHDATVPPRKPSGIRTNVQYSPSGDPDQRRDDDVNPSPDGPATDRRGDSDVEGVHDHPDSNIERE